MRHPLPNDVYADIYGVVLEVIYATNKKVVCYFSNANPFVDIKQARLTLYRKFWDVLVKQKKLIRRIRRSHV